ncbi:MAG: acyl carrier protein [Polyangiales bacterium]
MTREEIETTVRHAITKVAPDAEADLAKLDPDVDLRESLDLDSLDFLRVLTELEHALRLTLPASAHAQMRTLRGCVDTLASRA